MTKRRDSDVGDAGHDDVSSTNSMTSGRQVALEAGSSMLAAAAMLGLIFGGCCSNVYALEAIVKRLLLTEQAGTLLTFVQFLFVAVTGYVAQFDASRPPFFLAPNKVPLRRWVINIVLFFSINMLNNHAFSYDISVPVHIILRSGGSITTMAVGYLYGKRYSRIQALAVILLTLGVILAAWSDAQAKVTLLHESCEILMPVTNDWVPQTSSSSSRPTFGTGLVILFVAQLLSAIMGLYTEATYRQYGPQWRENLFYSHVLSLPLFLPFAPAMLRNLAHLASSQPFETNAPWGKLLGLDRVPRQLIYLVANVLTQYACIRGVNLLAARASALTVTIVLNIRKLVSLLLSIWLFGNSLASGTLIGAVVVFASGGLYSLGSSPKRTTETSESEKQKKA
ncbi:LOW QUALITY PROTEIN: UDP-N-acetylglucosamine transporter yea4 [Paramyrothecium foliicola]|nr:LOW QUALITY PROTEIN: UDP-N-acetylglucosamine transporter yea4 [Paramyrothecium foliicola]